MSVSASQLQQNNSTKAFTTSLVANGALLLVEIAAFLILKNHLGKIYSPRTYLPPPYKRAKELPNSFWRWLPALLVEDPKEIINKNGLDAYMVLRFLKMLLKIFLVFTILTFLVIVPVNTVGLPAASDDRIQRITWSNIANASDQKRFWAHITVVYTLTFFVIYLIRREMLLFLDMRHAFLISRAHSRLPQARTVLITNVPDELANEHDLRLFASFVPGGIDRVWIYRDTRILNKLFKRRQAACQKLESAESKVLKRATEAWRLKQATHRKLQKKMPDEERGDSALQLPVVPSRELLDELVPLPGRPKHRTGFLGLFGRKVETIPWCTEEIGKLNEEIREARETISKGKFLGSVFIRCNLQLGAHVLAQCVSYHRPLFMDEKTMETNPKDVVWENLDDGALEMTGRYAISWLATLGLIIAWGFPVAFIGTLSQIGTLCDSVHWLAWVCKARDPIPSIIQGILPPLLLAILFAILPFILRFLAWYECIPRYSLISTSVYRRFFLFLLIHGFLIVTLSSGVTQVIHDIVDKPTSAIEQLANKLPDASIFFLTYMVTQGLAGAGAALAQLFPILLHFIQKWLLGRTPRQAYNVTFLMPSVDFGVELPRFSLLACIAFAYSVLNPMINLFALLSYAMFFLAFKFLLTQVYDQPDESETGGLYFPMAISNLFVGLYIEQFCVMMLILLVITIVAHILIHRKFQPKIDFLPMSLATRKMVKRYERRQRKRGLPVTPAEEEEDLFTQAGLGLKTVKTMRRRIGRLPQQLDNTFALAQQQALAAAKVQEAEKEAAAATARASTSKEVQNGEPEDKDPQQKAVETAAVADLKNGDAPELYRRSTSTSEGSKRALAPRIDLDGEDDGDDTSDEELDDDEHAFAHPSTYVEQPWIWMPRDGLGLSKLLVDELRSGGVSASDIGAVMDDRGVVEVTRNPPDESWYGTEKV
ncbi:DUF221 family protein [Roridomyces roridus]|uniref:DUF221 family protein n=1 Tax=Roridomyces roridus TaxID=1738132 RepID=A0AAD7CEQ3_9AGAR|nr:DUF221 family protein [Roridomyces roridus]